MKKKNPFWEHFNQTLSKYHGIIGVHRPPPKILGLTLYLGPLDTKAPGPPLIYLVGLLSFSDPDINICVGPPNPCVALKQFITPKHIGLKQ